MPKKSISKGSVSISAPVRGADAFKDFEKPAHIHSQAATLLLIGSHLRGDIPAMQARFALTEVTPAAVTPLPSEDLGALGFPTMPACVAPFRTTGLQTVPSSRLSARDRP